MRPFARRHDFRFVRRTLLGREHEDTLHIIDFDLLSDHFNCNVAIQPLYVPEIDIVLDLGNPLERVAGCRARDWGYAQSEEEIRRDLVQIQSLLEADALPWFAEVGTPAGIISFLERLERRPAVAWIMPAFLRYRTVDKRRLIWALPAFLHYRYLGFSYLYVGRYREAQRALAAAAKTLAGDSRPWAIKDRELAERMRVLARDEPDRVPSALQEVIRETKANIGLK